jgi:hypothetical protein
MNKKEIIENAFNEKFNEIFKNINSSDFIEYNNYLDVHNIIEEH